MRYQYYISTNGGSTYSELLLDNSLSFKRKWEVGSDFRYCYRWSWPEIKIKKALNPTEYATLASWHTDKTKFATKILIKRYRGTTSGTLTVSGYFSIKDATHDLTKGVITVTPKTDDNYVLFDNYSQRSIEHTSLSSYVRMPKALTLGNWTNVNYNVFASTGSYITNAEDTSAVVAEDCYLPITATFYSGKLIRLTISAVITSGTAPTIYIAKTDGTVNSDVQTLATGTGQTYIFTITNSATNGRVYISSTAGGKVKFSCNITDISDYYAHNSTDQQWDAELLKTHLDVILDSFGYSTSTIKSTFIFNDALPTNPPANIATYMGLHSGYNYVTETANVLNYLHLIDRRNFSGNVITIDSHSFLDLMNSLNYYLNVYWFIDDDNNFRIEHLYFFEDLRTSGIVITDASYAPYKPESDKSYSHDQSKLYNSEGWSNEYDYGEDFVGKPITYSIYDTAEANLSKNSSLINTDIPNLLVTQDNIGGFCLAQCAEVSGVYEVQYGIGILSSSSQLNGNMALANLHDSYWRRGRCSLNGNMNGSADTFDSSVAFIKSQVKFFTSSDLNDYGYITTSLGDCQIDEYDRNDNDFITCNLLLSSD